MSSSEQSQNEAAPEAVEYRSGPEPPGRALKLFEIALMTLMPAELMSEPLFGHSALWEATEHCVRGDFLLHWMLRCATLRSVAEPAKPSETLKPKP